MAYNIMLLWEEILKEQLKLTWLTLINLEMFIHMLQIWLLRKFRKTQMTLCVKINNLRSD